MAPDQRVLKDFQCRTAGVEGVRYASQLAGDVCVCCSTLSHILSSMALTCLVCPHSETADALHHQHTENHQGHEDGCRIADEKGAERHLWLPGYDRAPNQAAGRLPWYGPFYSFVTPCVQLYLEVYFILLPAAADVEKNLVVPVTSDKGLCGGINTTVTKYTRATLALLQGGARFIHICCRHWLCNTVGWQTLELVRSDCNDAYDRKPTQG